MSGFQTQTPAAGAAPTAKTRTWVLSKVQWWSGCVTLPPSQRIIDHAGGGVFLTDWRSKSSGNSSGCSGRHKVSLLCVSPEVFKNLQTQQWKKEMHLWHCFKYIHKYIVYIYNSYGWTGPSNDMSLMKLLLQNSCIFIIVALFCVLLFVYVVIIIIIVLPQYWALIPIQWIKSTEQSCLSALVYIP